MTTTLGDTLLVFLADRIGTAYDLKQRHAETFGAERAVDVLRVSQTLNRQERLGYVQIDNQMVPSKTRRYALTEAGRARQRSWVVDVPAGSSEQDVLDRVLLAMAATDRATFDVVVAAGLALLQSRRPPAAGDPHPVTSARHARADLEAAMASTAIAWIRDLAERPRERDAA